MMKSPNSAYRIEYDYIEDAHSTLDIALEHSSYMNLNFGYAHTDMHAYSDTTVTGLKCHCCQNFTITELL